MLLLRYNCLFKIYCVPYNYETYYFTYSTFHSIAKLKTANLVCSLVLSFKWIYVILFHLIFTTSRYNIGFRFFKIVAKRLNSVWGCRCEGSKDDRCRPISADCWSSWWRCWVISAPLPVSIHSCIVGYCYMYSTVLCLLLTSCLHFITGRHRSWQSVLFYQNIFER